MPKINDEKMLVKLSKKGDLSAFESLVKKYQKIIFRHTRKILGDTDKAEDATQESFVKAYKNIRKFKSNLPFKPWIYKIATNTAYDMIKKDSKLTRMEYDAQDDYESPLDKLIKKEQVKKLMHALRKLPDIYKLPLQGFYFQQLSYKALASEYNLPINTIKTRIRRAKIILKNELE